MKMQLVVMFTVDVGDANLYEAQQTILERFPATFGPFGTRRVIDARIVGGLVDKEEFPIRAKPTDWRKAIELIGT